MSQGREGKERGYVDIADHALIGNLRTAALVSIDGSIESYCVPDFDSPSVFARILDKDKGGHFSITPTTDFSIKQNYMPSSNVLQTKFLNDAGVATVTDYLPRQANSDGNKPLLFWLIRRVELIRGKMPLRMECAPAFNYARTPHTMDIMPDDSIPLEEPIPTQHEHQNQHQQHHHQTRQLKALFRASSSLPYPPTSHPSLRSSTTESSSESSYTQTLDLRYIAEGASSDPHSSQSSTTTTTTVSCPPPTIRLLPLDLRSKGHLGLSVYADIDMEEGQAVTFILRIPPNSAPPRSGTPTESQARALGVPMSTLIRGASKLRALDDPVLTPTLLHTLQSQTNTYWVTWIRHSTYTGSWKEAVHRSALALKLLIYEPTGAVVASPTFSLPEFIGGGRNWDYRFSWIRDSSFTLYALIRLGFTQEAGAFMDFIFSRLKHRNPDGSLQIMYTIHGGTELEELELAHLDGHKGSKPVRIGNGAADHVQLDIYGELMDSIYLSQKFGRPLDYDTWVSVRELVEYVIKNYNQPDLSIWEVRNKKRHFTYSKIMMWVAIDRGLRLAEKRSLPCPRRNEWLAARDDIYEQIMQQSWNPEGKYFGQSYEDKQNVDSAVLIMPLVFFISASDPRFLNTLRQILKTPERGGLTANNLVYRYDVTKSDDGVGGEEGTFGLCTLWCVEALTRAGKYDKAMLLRSISMFEDFLQFMNHVGLCTEEISPSGEGLGNAVQGFTHVTLISAAYNLSRTMADSRS